MAGVLGSWKVGSGVRQGVLLAAPPGRAASPVGVPAAGPTSASLCGEEGGTHSAVKGQLVGF